MHGTGRFKKKNENSLNGVKMNKRYECYESFDIFMLFQGKMW